MTRGRVLVPAELPAIVAERDGERVGLLTFRPRPGGDTEIVTVDALRPGAGIGTALLGAVAELGRRSGWRRLWLITTNDNTSALRFYQRRGYGLFALHRDAVTAGRELKPSIPLLGNDGIPLRHELELELLLQAGSES